MMDNRDYIKDMFDSDGIKAPDSLSEDKMLRMLDAVDEKVSAEPGTVSTVSPVSKEPYRKAKVKIPRIPAKRFAQAAAVLLVAVMGISGIHTVMTTPPDVSASGSELYTFKSESEVKRMVRSMNSEPLAERLTNSFDRRNYEVLEDYAPESGVMSEGESYSASDGGNAKSATLGSSQAGGESHSSTYLQVDEVDESDIVKTDGKYIYYVNRNDEVIILSAKDGETEKVATIGNNDIENYVQDIYLKGDTLVTVGRFYMGNDGGSSGLAVYDISDRSKPALISYFRQSGSIVTSRMVGNFVYIVTQDNIYKGGRYLPVSGYGDTCTKIPATQISCVPEPVSSSYVVLSAVDITSGKQGKALTKAVFGASDDIYCNDHALYSASREWDSKTSTEYTRIARASLDGLDLKFSGTARVRGHIVNRFAMDEKNGYFRIATTSRREGMDVNNLYVLDPSMNEAGKVTGFARNESIKAVRYIGSKAYVITYQAIDPLFIIDLSDPASPRIEGEVMIDGFSTMLVPAGEGRLLGIGHATGDNGYGGEYDSGLKLALFDISDPSHPKVLDSKEFENMSSPAQSDSHALTVNQKEGWYAIPYEIYHYSDILIEEEMIDGGVIEDDMVYEEYEEPSDTEVPNDTTGAGDTETIVNDTPVYDNGHETGVLVFSAGDSISDTDQHALGSEYLARSVYIGDYIYALDRAGNCVSFRK